MVKKFDFDEFMENIRSNRVMPVEGKVRAMNDPEPGPKPFIRH
jgi:hypothetical protein